MMFRLSLKAGFRSQEHDKSRHCIPQYRGDGGRGSKRTLRLRTYKYSAKSGMGCWCVVLGVSICPKRHGGRTGTACRTHPTISLLHLHKAKRG